MPALGLLGFPLSHSFSKKYFAEKFSHPNLMEWSYDNYELETLDEFGLLLKLKTDLVGLNVTIPHKEEVIQYLDELDEEAREIGAVNTITISEDGNSRGYNTDVYGFQKSLEPLIENRRVKALILGTGGAAKAVKFVLNKLDIEFLSVSRSAKKGDICYKNLDEKIISEFALIVNTTPLGMHPNVQAKPAIPYQFLQRENVLFDLTYNPAITAFLQEGIDRNCVVENGRRMLELQAEKSWEIWNRTV